MASDNDVSDQFLAEHTFNDQFHLKRALAQSKLYHQDPTQQTRADCSYCEGQLQYKTKVTAPCGHSYHKPCLVQMAQATKTFSSTNCVLCRDEGMERFVV